MTERPRQRPPLSGSEILAELRRAKTRLPLFLVLLAVVLLVTAAPLGIFSWLTISEMKTTLVGVQQERQLEAASRVAERLDDFLAARGRDTLRSAELVGALVADRRSRSALELSALLDDTVILASLRTASGSGAQASAPELVLPDDVRTALERDAQRILEDGPAPEPPSMRAGYRGGPYVLGPHRILAISSSAPVQRRGRLLGAYQELVVLESVWADIVDMAPRNNTVFLIDPSGRVIAEKAAYAEQKVDPAPREKIVLGLPRMRSGSPVARHYELPDGQGKMRSYMGFYAATPQSWGVLLEVDEKLALQPVEQLLQRIALVGAVVAGLCLLITIVLGGIISRPITRLAQISQRLADGDFSVQARASHVRELDDLAHSFNRMAERLGVLVETFRNAARDANAMFNGTIRALAEAIDEKDPYTKGHSVRVNCYAVIIGRYMGMTREELRDLHVSSLLHDVGKIGIDDRILKKPAALTDEEFAVMKTHPTRGAKIMDRIPQMKNIIPGMKFHHERWSGGGYPSGLSAQEIPRQARIIAVADTFDAMTTERPYQRAFTQDEAAARINELKGVGFDPEVVEAFNRAFESGELREVLDRHPAVPVSSAFCPPDAQRRGAPASEVSSATSGQITDTGISA